MFARRIVITGLGAVTPVGNDVAGFWDALVSGRSGAAPLRGFAVNGSRPGYAAEIKEFAPERAGLPRKKLKMMGRHAQLAYAAVQEACADAGLTGEVPAVDSARLGILLGVGMLNADVGDLGRTFYEMRQTSDAATLDMALFERTAATTLFPLWLLRHIPNLAAAHASIALDAQGPSNTIATGCVAGANAIGEAARLIARGEADVVIAGGADARVSPLAMLRYRDLGWLATRNDIEPAAVSAPFDRSAAGFVNGEAAAVLVLESLEHAEARGARVRAELVAYAATNDAYDLLRPHPAACGLQRAMALCMRRSNDAVPDAIFSPAASVPAYDQAAATALSKTFGDRGPAVTATRSVLGHTHAASAAVDAVAAVKALESGQVPPMINLRSPIADLDFVRCQPRIGPLSHALVSAYSFGGHAAALMLRGMGAVKRRVAVTGIGIVSPLGIGPEAFWDALQAGRSGIATIARYDASGLTVRISAEVRGFRLSDYTDIPPEYVGPDGERVALDLRTQYAAAAAEMSVRDAGLLGSDAWREAHLYFGAGEGDNDVRLLARILTPWAVQDSGCDVAGLMSHAEIGSFALRDQLMEPTAPASLLAARYGIGGEVTTCLTACAASAQAIGEAMRRIQEGECDLALTGGAHAMTAPLDVLGFAMLSALSLRNDDPTRASRPFDLHRDGFVLGEGAGALVLEEWDRARRRGARIYGELIGYGTANDAYRVTDMHPDARGATRAIVNALSDAGVEPRDIGYVNAHGTSTIENDRAETAALHHALGDAAPSVPVSSTKSMTGHAVAAAGAMEAIVSLLALDRQILPPTINLETPDPECDLDYVPNTARSHAFTTALSNSFGFGGQNVALVLRAGSAA